MYRQSLRHGIGPGAPPEKGIPPVFSSRAQPELSLPPYATSRYESMLASWLRGSLEKTEDRTTQPEGGCCRSSERAYELGRVLMVKRGKSSGSFTSTLTMTLDEYMCQGGAFNLKSDAPVRIVKVVAFGAINGKHEKIQDIDLV